jgi:hypothetical protein
MEVLTISRWLIEFDSNLTRDCYSKINIIAAKKCDCIYCRNFYEVLNHRPGEFLPPEVMDLFEKLGIDYRKEANVYFLNKERNGLYCYGGEYYFIGNILNGPVSPDNEGDIFGFDNDNQKITWILSRKIGIIKPIFAGKSLVCFSFAVRIPWILATEEPE